jgi:beta-glucosidase
MIIGIMKTFLLTICFLSVQTGMVAIAQDKEQTPVYLDDTQPIEVRVQDALNRMTVEGKLVLVMHKGSLAPLAVPVWVFLNFG